MIESIAWFSDFVLMVFGYIGCAIGDFYEGAPEWVWQMLLLNLAFFILYGILFKIQLGSNDEGAPLDPSLFFRHTIVILTFFVIALSMDVFIPALHQMAEGWFAVVVAGIGLKGIYRMLHGLAEGTGIDVDKDFAVYLCILKKIRENLLKIIKGAIDEVDQENNHPASDSEDNANVVNSGVLFEVSPEDIPKDSSDIASN
jgi:uncharacterized membrane protein